MKEIPQGKPKTTAAHSSRGFTLLLAALVSSLVLTLGLTIVAIARKSVTLSSIGRDSQFAFYAADTGLECAIYWDLRHDYFSTSTPAEAATCDGQLLVMSGREATLPHTITFEFNPNGRCAKLSVTKNLTAPNMEIRSDGFNTTCDTISTSARALQRSVRAQY